MEAGITGTSLNSGEFSHAPENIAGHAGIRQLPHRTASL
jgi:hypothetical protein